MQLLQEGMLEQAADHLHEAAATAITLDQRPTAIRLLQLAAATYRSAGQPEQARALAEQSVACAARLDPGDPSLEVLALCEAAQTAQALGMVELAVQEFAQAAAVPGLPDAIRAQVLRRQATALVGLQRHDQARQALEQVLLGAQLSPSETARVRVDLAAIAQQGQMPDHQVLLERAEQAAQAFPPQADPDYAALHADLLLVQAGTHQQAGHLDLALQQVQQAMQISAAAAVAPSYTAAVLSRWKLQVQCHTPVQRQREGLLHAQQELATWGSAELAQAAFSQALEWCERANTESATRSSSETSS